MPKVDAISFHLRIPTKLKDRLETFASKEQKNLTQIVLDALREYLDRRDG